MIRALRLKERYRREGLVVSGRTLGRWYRSHGFTYIKQPYRTNTKLGDGDRLYLQQDFCK